MARLRPPHSHGNPALLLLLLSSVYSNVFQSVLVSADNGLNDEVLIPSSWKTNDFSRRQDEARQIHLPDKFSIVQEGNEQGATKKSVEDSSTGRMVDFNSGLWNLLSQVSMNDFISEDNGLSEDFEKYYTGTSRRLRNRIVHQDSLAREEPFHVPFRNIFVNNEEKKVYPTQTLNILKNIKLAKPAFEELEQLGYNIREINDLYKDTDIWKDDAKNEQLLTDHSNGENRDKFHPQDDKFEGISNLPREPTRQANIAAFTGYETEDVDPPKRIMKNPVFNFNNKGLNDYLIEQKNQEHIWNNVNRVIPDRVIPDDVDTEEYQQNANFYNTHFSNFEKPQKKFFVSASFVDPTAPDNIMHSFPGTVLHSSNTEGMDNQDEIFKVPMVRDFIKDFQLKMMSNHQQNSHKKLMSHNARPPTYQASQSIQSNSDYLQQHLAHTNEKNNQVGPEHGTPYYLPTRLYTDVDDKLEKTVEPELHSHVKNVMFNTNSIPDNIISDYDHYVDQNTYDETIQMPEFQNKLHLNQHSMQDEVDPSYVLDEDTFEPEDKLKVAVENGIKAGSQMVPLMLSDAPPQLPDHVIQMVNNVSQIIGSNRSESSLKKVFNRFKNIFEHAESVLSGENSSPNNTQLLKEETTPNMVKDVRPAPSSKNDVSHRLVIVYRPVLFVSNDNGSHWPRILGKGYRPTVLTESGETSETITKEVLDTLGPELLKNIKKYFVDDGSIAQEEDIDIPAFAFENANDETNIEDMKDKYVVISDAKENPRVTEIFSSELTTSTTEPSIPTEIFPNIFPQKTEYILDQQSIQKDSLDSIIENIKPNPIVPFLNVHQTNLGNIPNYDYGEMTKHEGTQYVSPTRDVGISTGNFEEVTKVKHQKESSDKEEMQNTPPNDIYHPLKQVHNIILSRNKAIISEPDSVQSLSELEKMSPGKWWITEPSNEADNQKKYVIRRIIKRRRKPSLLRNIIFSQGASNSEQVDENTSTSADENDGRNRRWPSRRFPRFNRSPVRRYYSRVPNKQGNKFSDGRRNLERTVRGYHTRRRPHVDDDESIEKFADSFRKFHTVAR